MNYRIENDGLGEIKIPEHVLYGIQTQRAVDNFPISGLQIHWEFVLSYLIIKKAAALTNQKCKVLDKMKARRIVSACNKLLSRDSMNHFVVDVYQAGAGTSFNMNMNEVITNMALDLAGVKRGSYSVINPYDHVNMSQSTNDTFPTAMRIACLLMLKSTIPTLKKLQMEIQKKSQSFKGIIKSGRTHLQDATPITLGSEFSGYSEVLKKHLQIIKNSQQYFLELGIGGTAVGTGINTPENFKKLVVSELNKITGFRFRMAKNFFEATQSMFPFVNLSNILSNLSIDLIRISNDLRLLNSGPRTGLNEINLPVVQAGSSIMPGKVNPSIPEMLNMVCYQVLGNNTTINLAAQAGQLELNVMMPVINYNLLQSINILNNSMKVFTNKCIKGIIPNIAICNKYAEESVGIATVLNTKIGYLAAADVVKESIEKNIPITKLLFEKKYMTEKEIENIFN